MEIDWGDLEALRRDRPALVLETLAAGDAESFKRAVAEGFDVNVLSDHDGSTRTPLHHAAASGDLAVIAFLLDNGARPSLDVADPTYDATPRGWAEFFGQPEAAAALEAAETTS